MSDSPRPSRRELFKLVGLVAGVAVVGGSVAACGELDSEQESALIGAWRNTQADIDLATAAREQFEPESPEDRALSRVVEARKVHQDKLAEAIAAAGEELPTDDAADGTGESTTPTTSAGESGAPATIDAVVDSVTSSGRTARESAAILEGYPSALAGSIGAACSALAQVTLGLALGRGN